MRKKVRSRVSSLLLVFVMVVSMVPSAFAATTHTVSVVADTGAISSNSYTEGSTISNVQLYTIKEKDVYSVTVENDDGYRKDHFSFDNDVGILTAGTAYVITTKDNADGTKTLYLSTNTGIQENIKVSVVTRQASYSVTTNTGVYGEDNNYGSHGNNTCSTNKPSQTLVSGSGYSVKFTPASGHEISHVNIRAGYSNKSNLVAITSTSSTIQGVSYSISTGTDGSVTVSAGNLFANVYITALTKAEIPSYTLTVTTDGYTTSNISSTSVKQGSSESVVLTPNSGWNVDSIEITSNGQSKSISVGDTSVTVNGITYTLNRNISTGKATLTVPKMTADVSILATSTDTLVYVETTVNSRTTSSQEGVYYLENGGSYMVIYRPKNGSEITDIKLTTKSGTVTLDVDDYYTHTGSYRCDLTKLSNGNVEVRFDYLRTNVTIAPVTNTYENTIQVTANSGVTSNVSRTTTVQDGDDFDVTFTPVNSNVTITSLKIVYDGASHTVNPQKTSYVYIDGVRHDISVSNSGAVTLYMVNIREDVTITASTDYTSGNRTLTKSQAGNSEITFSKSSPVSDYEEVRVTVETTSKTYGISSIVVKEGTKSVTIDRGQRSFNLNGVSYSVTWKTHTDGTETSTFVFDGLQGNLTVTSKTARLTTLPSLKDTEVNNYRYQAYMQGIGNGFFNPDGKITRAEAITMLVSLFTGETNATLSYYDSRNNYTDVNTAAWYARYINYASSKGYLSVLPSAGAYIYPNAEITRSELMALLCQFSGRDVSYTDVRTLYSDVNSSHWAIKYINYSSMQGWVKGTGNNKFEPDRSVSRAEAATMCNRITGRVVNTSIGGYTTFIDVPTTHWAYWEVIAACNDIQYVNGIYY